MENLKALISKGNHKLPTNYAIFNMGPAKECPSLKLGLCQAYVNDKCVCYAMKAEIQYYLCVPSYRKRQSKYWREVTADQFVDEFLALNARKRKPFDVLRINESGDFYSQACVDKACEIAAKLSLMAVKTYVYTARKDLDFTEAMKHSLIICGSGFMKKGVSTNFEFLPTGEKVPKGAKVCAGNCRICDMCLKGVPRIMARQH